jgi:hypothetical protein
MPGAAVTLALLSATARAQPAQATGPAAPPATAPSGDYVSREEYDRLKRDQEQMRRDAELMRQELDALRRDRAAARPPATGVSAEVVPATGPAAGGAAPPASQADLDAVNQAVQDIKDDLSRYHYTDSRFTLVGDAAFGYNAPHHGTSTFFAQISPLVLWRPADHLLIEAAADIGIGTDATGTSSTSFDLTIANASYLVNDYLAVGAGLFIVPFGQYHNHFDPPWIKEFPDDPLPFGDNPIAPNHEVGAFVKGAVPVTVAGRDLKFTYDFYVANGPQLVTNDSTSAGSLNFDDFSDLNNNKAVGGRLGFLPMPNLELGYSIQASDPSPAGFQRTHALLQAVDLNWRPDVDALQGWIDLRGEYVWSDVSRATFDPTHSQGFGPIDFGNHRDGGYVQLAYRPAYITSDFLRRLEFAVRYDFLNTPLQSPGGTHEHRFTLGVDYWVTPQAVLETAYEFDRRREGGHQDALLIQFGLRL